MTVTSQGFGRQKGHSELPGSEYVVDFLPKIRIEVAIDDSQLDAVVDAIPKQQIRERWVTARSSSPPDEVIRIRTGETGADAV